MAHIVQNVEELEGAKLQEPQMVPCTVSYLSSIGLPVCRSRRRAHLRMLSHRINGGGIGRTSAVLLPVSARADLPVK